MELQEPEFKLSRLISVLLYLEIEPTQLLSLGTEPGGGGGGGGGGGVLPCMGYIGMCHCEGYGFQTVYSGIWYANQTVWV